MVLFSYYNLFVFFSLLGGFLQWFYLFNKKHMPDLLFLSFKFFLVIPIGILGSRLWTYFFSQNLWDAVNEPVYFWERLRYFFGLNQIGMRGLSIQGAIIFSLLGFVIIFYFYSKKYRISLLFCLDVIVKSFLVSQIIGRWGNYFNQELLGPIFTYDYPNEFSWIDSGFAKYLKFDFETEPGILRHPLFLYEIFANFFAWLFLTFLLPFFPKIINYFKKQKKSLNFINNKNNIPQIKISRGKIFNYQILPFKVHKSYQREKKKISQKVWYQRYFYYFLLFLQRDSKTLITTFEKKPLPYLRVGVIFGSYFVLQGIIRLFLQPLRNNLKDLPDYLNPNQTMRITPIISIIFIFFGLLTIVFSIFVIPKKWRYYNFFYEKWYLIK